MSSPFNKEPLILQLVASGIKDTKRLAALAGCEERTVQFHLRNNGLCPYRFIKINGVRGVEGARQSIQRGIERRENEIRRLKRQLEELR